MENLTPEELYSQLYDTSVPEHYWDGEIEFYLKMLSESPLVKTHGALELACGTGRVTLALARQGIRMTGLDLAPEMVKEARAKSVGMAGVQFYEGDMRSFETGSRFGCVIVPAHSFMYLITAEDQVRCLAQVRKHLLPGGQLILHLDPPDVSWLADLIAKREDTEKMGRILTHPVSGEKFRQTSEWSYAPATQTFTLQNDWHRVDDEGNILQTFAREPQYFHCCFPVEMEHLLGRMGFTIEAVYGDFFMNPFGDKSPHLILVAKVAKE